MSEQGMTRLSKRRSNDGCILTWQVVTARTEKTSPHRNEYATMQVTKEVGEEMEMGVMTG